MRAQRALPVCLITMMALSDLSLCRRFHNDLHKVMTDNEKEIYFGEEKPEDTNYEVIEIYQPRITNVDDKMRRVRKSVQFSSHGEDFKLEMKPNTKLLAPYAMIVKRSSTEDLERLTNKEEVCHYLHQDEETVASFDMCDPDNFRGLVIKNDRRYEVIPLNSRLKRMLGLWKTENDTEVNGGERNGNSRESKSLEFDKGNLHMVKRMKNHGVKFDKILKQQLDGDFDNDTRVDKRNVDTKIKRAGRKKVLETAVFLDSAAYTKFSSYFRSIGKSDVDTELRRLLLSYMNGIQAVYLLPSLYEAIDISIVRMELWTFDPYNNYEGDREPLLNTFCEYQEHQNPRDDSEPGHWDVALLVSGLNFYAVDHTGRKNGVTMGLARVGGMCTQQHNCVIGELGVTNSRGKPYPSAGFTSVFVMAHEIGHNLGMYHDDTAGCDKDGFIMSPSRGTKGESKWSRCSVQALQEADLSCLHEESGGAREHLAMEAGVFPGEVWSANRQCQIFLLDSDAHMDHYDDTFDQMCYSLKCRTPQRAGYYRAGPALEGTACGSGKWCQDGECVNNNKKPVAGSNKPGKWSEWMVGQCQSGCTEGSVGYQEKTRHCEQSRIIHTVGGCKGPATTMGFCDDSRICNTRKDITRYATEHCKIFSNYVSTISPSGQGVQARHAEKRLWQACAIFCTKKDTGAWYTPRLELNDLPLSPYFPDGTLCHTEGTTNYYCQRHFCLSEKDVRGSRDNDPDLDIPMNAAPKEAEQKIPAMLTKYFTLDANFEPLPGGSFYGQTSEHKESEWEVKDYIDY